MDLPLWKIALIYQHRWQVEIFFRWLKCVVHFDHFFCESREGMTLRI
jgi:IS4 transposase